MTFPQSDPTSPWPEQNPAQPTYGAGYPATPPTPPAGYPPPAAYPQAPGQPLPGQPLMPPGAYGYYNPAAQTNTMAILSLVFAFVFPPLGIVFGHMAKRQIGQRGEGGSGLATAGMILGYIFTALMVLYCIGIIAAIAASSNN
jgi:uncharacterized protein DUF4190